MTTTGCFRIIAAVLLSAGLARAGYVPFQGQNSNTNSPVGAIVTAANWVGGALPSGSSTGLVSVTGSPVSFGAAGGWYNLAVLQTGGFIDDRAQSTVAMRGGTSGSGITSRYVIDDPRTNYAAYTNAIVNQLNLWSQYSQPCEFDLLSGVIILTNQTAGGLKMNSTFVTVNIKNGRLKAAGSSLNAGTINLLAGGRADVQLGTNYDNGGAATTNLDATINFQTGNAGSVTINNFGNSAWTAAATGGKLKVNGSTASGLNYFSLSNDGATISLVPELIHSPNGNGVSLKPVLTGVVTNSKARLQWPGQGGVNYELQGSPDVRFQSVSSKFFMGDGGAVTAEEPVGGQSARFWRVLAYPPSNGIGVAQAGEYAGKLIHYDTNGATLPLRAFGVNYYDAFTRYSANSNDTSFVQGLAYLQAHNIPVARVLAGDFWPKDWGLYFTNKTEYYRRLDYFVACAEQYHVGLILDLFWRIETTGEIVDGAVAAGYLVPGTDFIPPNPRNTNILGNLTYAEYKRELGRTNSGSAGFIRYYTREMVARYAHSSAVWAWEFGNEYNLGVDHPNIKAIRTCRVWGANQGDMLPNTSTNLTVLPAWTGPDDLVRAEVQTAKQNFADTVRETDTWRPILSGNSIPRTSAWNNWQFHTWTPDTRAQMAAVLPVDNPAPMDTVTAHIYPEKPGSAPEIYFPSDSPVTNLWLTGQYKLLMDYFVTNSARMGRPLVIGEWGAAGDGTTPDEQTTFNSMMQALIDSGVQLSLLWTFDTRNQGMLDDWWMQTGMILGYPASPKLYQISNSTTNLWSLEKANQTYGSW